MQPSSHTCTWRDDTNHRNSLPSQSRRQCSLTMTTVQDPHLYQIRPRLWKRSTKRTSELDASRSMSRLLNAPSFGTHIKSRVLSSFSLVHMLYVACTDFLSISLNRWRDVSYVQCRVILFANVTSARTLPDPLRPRAVASSLIVAPIPDIPRMPKRPSKGKDLALGAPGTSESKVVRRIMV